MADETEDLMGDEPDYVGWCPSCEGRGCSACKYRGLAHHSEAAVEKMTEDKRALLSNCTVCGKSSYPQAAHFKCAEQVEGGL